MKKSHTSGVATLRRYCVLLVVLVLLISALPASGVFAADATQSKRLNVMLVIDGSGSLQTSTDKTGMRYEAIDLFLALLTNEGNNVGAIVFNHETRMTTPISPIAGKADKVALSDKIREAGVGGDTNIGGALLTAVNESIAMSEKNGMESVVVLFSDGRTDVPQSEEALEESLANKEEATVLAQEAGIPVYSICLAANSVASPEELQEISDRTSGGFVSVSKAEDLTSAFEAFYSLIFSGSGSEITQTTFPDDGKLSFEVQIPSYGAEEVNIILNTTGLEGKAINAPSGALTDTQIADNTMSGGYYDVLKLVDPEKGLWTVDLTGVPGTDVTVNVLYNTDSYVSLTTDDGKSDYKVGDDVTFQVNLMQQGNPITDASVTQEYTAQLTLTNPINGESQTVEMTPDANGTFVYTMTGDDYCSWTAKADMTYSNLTMTSNELAINFGNTAPVANPDETEVKATVTPISGRSRTVKLSDFFSDAQDKDLTYSIVSSQLIQDTIDLDEKTGEMVVNTAKSRSGDVVVQAMDAYGATAQMTVHFKVTNLTGLIFGTIVAAVLAGIIILCVTLYAATHKPWKGMFTVTDIGSGIERTHGGFRGKVPLVKLGIRGCGLDGALVATGHNRMEFRSKKPIYSGTGFQPDPKKVPLMNGSNTIYADEEHTMGIEIDVQPKGGGFGF